MSFSSKVKAEIAQVFGEHRHCRIAFLSAIIYGTCTISNGNTPANIEPKTDNTHVLNAFSNLMNTNIKNSVLKKSHDSIIAKSCCKRAYLRAAFLCAGSVNGPGKAYHLEFTANNEQHSTEIQGLLRSFGLSPKSVYRKNKFIIYFKESDQIADVLNIIGAHKQYIEFEMNRAEKEVGNSINRMANFETANIDKSILAAVKQIEDIKLISATIGLDALPNQLQECAILRMDEPALSLVELGQRLLPPIGKSGVNHRFRKLAEIAKELTTNKTNS